MAQFIALEKGVEVNGETVFSFLNGMGSFSLLFENTLRENGIDHPSPGNWYPQQSWLNAFRVISGKTGPATLKSIGKRIIDSANWPPQVDSIASALQSIDVAFHMNHRGGEIGHYRFESTGDRSARIVCDNPYPCDFDLGIIESAVRRFATPSDKPQIVHDEMESCRKDNGDICTYLITW